jgi:hypothetical protein
MRMILFLAVASLHLVPSRALACDCNKKKACDCPSGQCPSGGECKSQKTQTEKDKKNQSK